MSGGWGTVLALSEMSSGVELVLRRAMAELERLPVEEDNSPIPVLSSSSDVGVSPVKGGYQIVSEVKGPVGAVCELRYRVWGKGQGEPTFSIHPNPQILRINGQKVSVNAAL